MSNLLEGILIFIVFLGPLIFFHELGHFLFARFFGVKVEVFSMGFGPKIFKHVYKGTEYAVSIIPLGGYVKMFGDDPFSEVALSDEEKAVAFNHKSKWARFWIVFGGPLANLILAYCLYLGLLSFGEKVPETRVGVVTEKSVLFEKGLRTGDVLVGINDEKVLSFDDFNIKGSKIDHITVQRGSDKVSVDINMGLEPFIQEFVSLAAPLKRPVFVNIKGDKFYLSSTQKPTTFDSSFEEMLSSYKGTAYLYSLKKDESKIEIDPASESLISTDPTKQLVSVLIGLGFYPIDMVVKSINMSSPADAAGIKRGDILTKVNGLSLNSFEDLRQTLQTVEDGKEVSISFISNGVEVTKSVKPEVREIDKKKVKIIGIESSVDYVPAKFIYAKEDNLLKAFATAFNRTTDGIVKTFNGYKKLITREVSLNNIGGPLAIGKVASDSFNISLSMFFRLMAIISINLGVINLFPIPVLDGGHIMFLILETINRGPLSRRKLEFAQRIGVSLLFLLIFIALFNDVTRHL
jgi:regulator of sigma E protease